MGANILPNAAYMNGKLIIKHEPKGPYPVLVPHKGVALKVNGTRHELPVSITSADEIEVVIVEEDLPGRWSLSLSSNGLTAVVAVSPSERVKRMLPNLEPAAVLELIPVEETQLFPPISMERLLNELKARGVSYGLDFMNCAQAVEAVVEMEIVVAKGEAPIPGKDAQIELLFSTEDRQLRVEADDTTQIDHKERFEFTCVFPGAILAKKTPPVMGNPGTSVRGETLLPPPVVDLNISLGKGTEMRGNHVISTKSGRPIFKRQGPSVRFEVDGDLVVDGDVDLSTGNITFAGNIIITGDVTNGMLVNAGEEVRVGGVVDGASIQASGSVSVAGNIIGSTVQCGSPPILLRRIMPIRLDLERVVDDLIQSLASLGARIPGDKRHLLQRLLIGLLENRFSDITKHLEALVRELQGLTDELAISLGCNAHTMERYSKAIQEQVFTEDDVYSLKVTLRKLEESISSFVQVKVDLVAKNCINSTIISNGNVTIMGGGCYNSHVLAGGKASIYGVFRGGELLAGGDVFLAELGSSASVRTAVQVPSTATVTINVVHDNATVLLGRNRHNFSSTQKLVVVKA